MLTGGKERRCRVHVKGLHLNIENGRMINEEIIDIFLTT